MSNYMESKKILDKISSKYSCKGDIIMRTAVQYIVEYGQYILKDDEFINEQISRIEDKHRDAEADGKILWVAKDLELEFLNCARELAEINAYDLIIYMQKEMFWSMEGGLDYGRSIELLKRCVYWMRDQEDDDDVMYDVFNECGFDDDEIQQLGFEYLLDSEEK